MAAYDYVAMPGSPTPASYAPPIVDMSAIGQLVDKYQQGQQYGVLRNQQTAFQEGFPKDANGNPDYSAMANRLLQVAGPAAAQPYFQLAMQQGNAAAFPTGGQPPQGPAPATSQQTSSGPANITGASPSGPPGSNPAPNTLRGLLTSGMGQSDAQRFLDPAMTPMWSKILGGQVGPDDPLTEQQMRAAVARFPQLAQQGRGAQDQQSAAPGGPPFAPGTPSVRNPQSNAPLGPGEDVMPPTRSTSAAETRNNGVSTRQPATESDPQIARANQAIDMLTNYLTRPGLTQGQQDAATSKIKQLEAQIEARTKYLNENATQTETEKNLGSGASSQAALNDQLIKASGTNWAGIKAKADQYEDSTKPVTTLAHGILSNPAMYSGIGAQTSLAWNKVKDFLGAPKAAALQQGLEKINAITTLSAVNEQRDELGGAGLGSGRIFSQQIDQVVKSNPNLENTVWGNRMLINIMDRLGARSGEIRDQALAYRNAHGGILDDGWEKQKAAWVSAHPVFTPEEIADPTVLGVPEAPPNIKTPQQAAAWVKSQGLNPNDRFRKPDGNYGRVPGKPQAPQQ